jgi:hypothetical protein
MGWLKHFPLQFYDIGSTFVFIDYWYICGNWEVVHCLNITVRHLHLMYLEVGLA